MIEDCSAFQWKSKGASPLLSLALERLTSQLIETP